MAPKKGTVPPARKTAKRVPTTTDDTLVTWSDDEPGNRGRKSESYQYDTYRMADNDDDDYYEDEDEHEDDDDSIDGGGSDDRWRAKRRDSMIICTPPASPVARPVPQYIRPKVSFADVAGAVVLSNRRQAALAQSSWTPWAVMGVRLLFSLIGLLIAYTVVGNRNAAHYTDLSAVVALVLTGAIVCCWIPQLKHNLQELLHVTRPGPLTGKE